MQRAFYGLMLIQVFLLGVPALAQQKDDQSENQLLREEVKELKEGRKQDGERIKRLEDIVDKLVKEKAVTPPPAPEKPAAEKPPAKEKGQEALEREVEEFLKQPGPGGKQGAAPATAPSAPKTSLGSPISLGLGGGQIFNPDISVIGDVLFHENSSGNDADLGSGKFLFRELELAFSQVVDPFARADAFISISEDPHDLGKFDIEVEEAYMTLLTLPYDLQARVGRFRTDIGKANTMHLHALPWVDYPEVVKNYFGSDGLKGDGLSASWLVPNPGNKYIELTYQLFNNDNDPAFAGPERSSNVVQLAHLKTFWDLSKNTSLEVGGTAMTAPNTHSDARWTTIEGADLTLKWKDPKLGLYKGVTWMNEALLAQKAESGNVESSWGMYSSLEYQFAQRWKAAVRYDFSQLPDNASFDENAASVYLTFMQSEYAFWRLGYMFRDRNMIPAGGVGDRDEHEVFLQLNFGIGPHRAHTY